MMEAIAGAGILTGGSGIDTLDYKLSAGAVFVSFDPDTSATDGGDAEGDAASESENIIGSKFNDTLIGDGAINWLDGGVGNDELNGGAGADQLTGGSGVDTVSYLVSDGVSVNLGTGAGSGGKRKAIN